jgi:hypothetical protein
MRAFGWLAAVSVVVLSACGLEPGFIEACQKECACTGDEFACRAPKSGGCDNAHRREWTLASQAGCEAEYLAKFNCFATNAVCTTKNGEKKFEAPAGACTAVESRYDACR